MRSSRSAAVLLLIGLLNPCVAPFAKAQAPAGTASPGVASGQHQQEEVLRTNAFSVLIDLVVTDKNVAVHGIDPRRFHIYEDGDRKSVV